jgi:hypothetical protein
MRNLLIALYSRPGLLPIAGMTLAGVVVIGWDLVRLSAGRWATTAATRRGRRPLEGLPPWAWRSGRQPLERPSPQGEAPAIRMWLRQGAEPRLRR